MGKPIKDRGIKWVESYGEKSAYLKENMEQQVGAGSYFRWEGHDSSTQQDYYVVVSPGFSKKHGYHFFAGLRKMPADQGASGKKFVNQAEALSYAMDTWGVPRPQTPPAKAYTTKDIVNIPIVLEAQHDSAKASSGGTIIISAKSVEAMSLGHSTKVTSNFAPCAGEKTYPEMLCWAYKATPFVGMLAAMNMRKRFRGNDTLNVPQNMMVRNMLKNGLEQQAPLAPRLATVENPNERTFKTVMAGGQIDNKLMDVKRVNGKITGYTEIPPLDMGLQEGHRVVTHENIRIYPVLTFPANLFNEARMKDWDNLFHDLKILGKGVRGKTPKDYDNVEAPFESEEKTGGEMPGVEIGAFPKPPEDMTGSAEIRFSVDPHLYHKFAARIAQFGKQVGTPNLPLNVHNTYQKTLVDLVGFDKDFDLKKPAYEIFNISNAQQMHFDGHGVPVGIMVNKGNALSRAAAEEEASSIEGEDTKNPQGVKLVPHDVKEMLAKHMDEFNYILGSVYAKFADGDQKAGAQITQFSRRIAEARKRAKAGDPAPLNALRAQAAELLQKSGADPKAFLPGPDGKTAYAELFRRNYDEYEAAKAAYNTALENEPPQSPTYATKLSILRRKVNEAHAKIKRNLDGFSTMCGFNLVDISRDMVADGRTCPPVLANLPSASFDTDSYGLPIKDGKLHKGAPSVVARPTMPKAAARAKRDTTQDGQNVFAAIRFDPKRDEYVYDRLPEGAKPYEEIRGAHVVVKDAYTVVPDNKGGVRRIARSQFALLDASKAAKHRYISGPAYEINVSPWGEGSHRRNKNIHEANLSVDSFVPKVIKRVVDHEGGVFKANRMLSPTSLFSADPAGAKGAAAYSYVDEKTGKTVDMTGEMYKKGDYVHFKNTRYAMMATARVMGMDMADVGPFTPLRDNDIRIIYDAAAEGTYIYKSVTAFQQSQTNPAAQADKKLVEDGRKYAAAMGAEGKDGPVQRKFDYGRICSACDEGGDVIKPEIAEEIKKALADPAGSLKPRAADIFYLEFSPDGGKTWHFVQNLPNTSAEAQLKAPAGERRLLVFGSRLVAERAIGDNPLPVVENLRKASLQVRISQETLGNNPAKPWESPLNGFRTSKNGMKTINSNQLLNRIDAYNAGGTVDTVDAQNADKWQKDYAASAEEKLEGADQTMTPEEEEKKEEETQQQQQQQQPEPQPGQPQEPVTLQDLSPEEAAASPEDFARALEQQRQPAQAPAGPAQTGQPQPPAPGTAQPPPQQEPAQPPLTDEERARLKAKKPPIQTPSGPQASTLAKLVALAERLEDEGRLKEAEAIDKLIAISARKRGA